MARAVLAATLSARLEASSQPDDLDAALLIVSELAANAVRAGATTLSVLVRLHHDELEVVVTDDAPGWPTPRRVTADAVSGRGLFLVEALAGDWGVRPVEGGKSVWATLGLPSALTVSLPCDLTRDHTLTAV